MTPYLMRMKLNSSRLEQNGVVISTLQDTWILLQVMNGGGENWLITPRDAADFKITYIYMTISNKIKYNQI
jgi:hypothetical protein